MPSHIARGACPAFCPFQNSALALLLLLLLLLPLLLPLLSPSRFRLPPPGHDHRRSRKASCSPPLDLILIGMSVSRLVF